MGWTKGKARARKQLIINGRVVRAAPGRFLLPEIESGERSPDDLCGGKRLSGEAFLSRKLELEKEDRDRRAAAQRYMR